MAVTTQADVRAAEEAYDAAETAFRDAVQGGGHGAPEYDAWHKAKDIYVLTQELLNIERTNAAEARNKEHWWLRKEVSRINGIATETGGKWAGLPKVRAEWLRRASAFTGKDMTEINLDAIGFPRPYSSRPSHIPDIPDYATAVGQLLAEQRGNREGQ